MDIAALLTPDGVPLWAALAVIVASFFTSAVTAAFSLGGGLALLAVMSALLPAPAVVPVHGVAQAGSNGGRLYFQRNDVVWSIVLWFSIGGVIGSVAGGMIAVETPVWILRAGVGAFILWTLWGPMPKSFAPGRWSYFLIGLVACFLAMFFGTTSPIVAAMLSVSALDRLARVSTHAAAMVVQHIVKTAAFGVLGFAYGEWLFLIAAILISGFAGTFVGTRFLRSMPEETFKRGFKIILSAIAAWLIVLAAMDFRTG